jgi:putative tryptophan/tyrosine transport system substrate-binding protein
MKAKILVYALPALILTTIHLAMAQQAAKVPRIGFLVPGSQSAYSTHIEAFRQGLRDLGYTEGKNIAIEYRYPENNFDSLAAELVSLKVDVIFTGANPGVRAVKRATNTIPIVMVTGDAVRNGFISSLARPGGNITGLSFLSPEVRGKQLELLKEVFPKITRIAVLLDPAMSSASSPDSGNDIEIARQVGLQAQILEVRSVDELESAFRTAIERRAGAFLVRAHPLFRANQKRLVDLAAKSRLPALYPWKEFVEAGGLMAYGPNLEDLYRRAAAYVAKILKGRTPADLPVEQPTKFEFIVNLKTAKQIGVTIPQSVLYRADTVIK